MMLLYECLIEIWCPLSLILYDGIFGGIVVTPLYRKAGSTYKRPIQTGFKELYVACCGSLNCSQLLSHLYRLS